MAFNYSRIAGTANRLLAKFGQTVTLRKYEIGAYDPVTSTAAQVATDYSRVGAIFDFGGKQTLGPGGLIQVGDKQLLMDVNGAAPELEDHVIVGGVEYVLKGVGVIAPAGVPVVYDLHLRT